MHVKEILIVVILVFYADTVFTSQSRAHTIHIPGDHSTIQAGIDTAVDGDTVLVAGGIYKGIGNREIDFLGKAIVVKSSDGPESTIIDGESDGRVFHFRNSEGPQAKLEGFTITKGYAYRSNGAGIRCSSSSPTILNCIITGNEAWGYGGGIYCSKSSSLISQCTIFGNSCGCGGGIACSESSPVIIDCTISDNNAGFGGGIYGLNSFLTISCSTVNWNSASNVGEGAPGYGGGICCNDGSITNCVIAKNGASGGRHGEAYGGGIYCGSATITNSVIVSNDASVFWFGFSDGGGILYEGTASVTNCILWDNSPNEISSYSGQLMVRYSDIEGGWEGEGNIDKDPLFRDPDNDDFHLMVTYCDDPYDSPCIDAGDLTIIDDVLDCWHGLGLARYSDMGAYGGNNSGWSTEVEEDEGVSVPRDFILFQNYPNPFNLETILRYSLYQSGLVTLSIYNILGQRMVTLLEDFREAGEYNVVWNAAGFSSGIYFARLEAGGVAKTVKMVLLR